LGQAAVTSPEPHAIITPIPDCRNDMFLLHDRPCLTLLYSPANVPEVEALISQIISSNKPPIDRDQVKGFANASEVDEFLLRNPQSALAAVHVNIQSNMSLSYVLQTNTTAAFFKGKFQDPNMYIQIPLQAAFERAAARIFHDYEGNSISWNVNMKVRVILFNWGYCPEEGSNGLRGSSYSRSKKGKDISFLHSPKFIIHTKSLIIHKPPHLRSFPTPH
jgi:hypothetical protein